MLSFINNTFFLYIKNIYLKNQIISNIFYENSNKIDFYNFIKPKILKIKKIFK